MSIREWHTDIDWTLPPSVLIKTTGLSKYTIMKMKKARGLSRQYKNSVQWQDVDWSKNDEQIMHETGRSQSAVKLNRNIYGPDLLQQKRDFYASLDWSKTDAELEKSTILKRKHIHSLRKKYGGQYKLQRDKDVFWQRIDWNKPSRDLVAETGFCYEVVRRHRLQFGHPATIRYGKVHSIDYRLSNRKLSELHGIPMSEVWKYKLAAADHQRSAREMLRKKMRGERVLIDPKRPVKKPRRLQRQSETDILTKIVAQEILLALTVK